jgi:hypothetical protein
MPCEPCDQTPLDGRQADGEQGQGAVLTTRLNPSGPPGVPKSRSSTFWRRPGAGSPGGSLPTTRQAYENDAAMQESATGEESALGGSRHRQG